jgi:hypothetical protein
MRKSKNIFSKKSDILKLKKDFSNINTNSDQISFWGCPPVWNSS